MTEDHRDDASFERRLREAESRRGASPASREAPKGASPSLFGVGMRVGVELVSALGVAMAIGWGLDHWLHTTPLFIIIFILFGGAAGILNVWRVLTPGKNR